MQHRKNLFPATEQTVFWALVLIAAIALVRLLGQVMAPFIVGMAIAYLLNPMVTSLSRFIPRSVASLVMLVLFALIVLGVVIGLSPLIGRQLSDVGANLPQYLERLSDWFNTFIESAIGRIGEDNAQRIRDAVSDHVGSIFSGTQKLLQRLWSSGLAVFDIITFLIITPVVAFYCMRDWANITQKIDNLFPRHNADTLRAITAEFSSRLAGFVRGQLLVCVTLGVLYATALSAVGLNFGLAIGLLAGFLTFIPYVGTIVGFISSVGVALVQYPDYKMPLVVVVIFFIGQFIEGNILTPKMVGDRIGLHPVWVIFALMAGGKLFGFTGMLLAVPVAAMIGVLVRYGVEWYKNSSAYAGYADDKGQ